MFQRTAKPEKVSVVYKGTGWDSHPAVNSRQNQRGFHSCPDWGSGEMERDAKNFFRKIYVGVSLCETPI